MQKNSNKPSAKSTKTIESTHQLNFPVVGIGASAGGLEALQEFFENLSPDSGAAYVIVQHLSPDYKSLMAELLARYTSMTIHRVEDGMQVEKNHVYLIPPRNNMTIFHGKLLLNEQKKNLNKINLPIDIFLRSLAQDQEKNAVGIILSGTGSDGTLGIRAIKEFGGVTMVQDDRTAKFDGMPRSSISTGMVDYILPPAKLAKELVSYFKHPFTQQSEKIEKQISKDENQLSKVIATLRDAKGVDFSNYKETTIIRRLEKRISINRFDTIEQYADYLSDNKREINILFNEMLIGVTRFFRDEDAFQKLSEEVLPKLMQETSNKQELRIWVAGCSTGEEAYSLAILIKEFMSRNSIHRDVKIFATDIDERSLEFAGTGLYPDSIASDVSADRISRYFDRREGGFQVKESLRSMIIFARHNIFQDPPFSKIHLISCRNLLIYLNNQIQQKVFGIFYISLTENGYLFLGSSESLGNFSDGFTTIDNKSKIFSYNKGFKPTGMGAYGVLNMRKSDSGLKNVNAYLKPVRSKTFLLDGVFDEILGVYIPPTAITDSNYNIIHTINNISKYLSLPIGEVNLNLLKMLPKNLSLLVSSLLRRAQKKDSGVVMTDISVDEISKTDVTITARKIVDKRSSDTFFMVSIEEVVKEPKARKVLKPLETIDLKAQYEEQINQLEKDLQYKSESLQATVEELETSNEELQSSNEELVASNEELQSTNEELQSVNEELYTVNSEHIKKIEELTELNSDVDNLLKNTGIGSLYLDRELNIRKVNSVATRLTNIMVSDIGRPVKHISFDQFYKNFIDDIDTVVESLKPIDKELLFNGNEWFLMRILPYRTSDNAVEGIIITFVDISSMKHSQKDVENLQERLDMAMDIGEISWWDWNYETNEVVTGRIKYEVLGYKKDEIGPGFEAWVHLLHPQDKSKAMDAMRKHLSGDAPLYEVEYRIKSKSGEYLWFKDKGGVVEESLSGKPKRLTGVVMNITKEKREHEFAIAEKKNAEETISENNKIYEQLFKTLDIGIVFHNPDGTIIHANPTAEKLLGLSLSQLKGLKPIDSNWKAIRQDGSEFPGEEHPAMIALSTGEPVCDIDMGVYNPQNNAYKWLRISALPLYKKGAKKPYQVYAAFKDITHLYTML